MTAHRFGTLLESVTTQLAGVFVIRMGSKLEENSSTTGANLARLSNKDLSKLGGVVEQNCEAGAVEHCRRLQGVGNSFPPDAVSIAPIGGLCSFYVPV